MFIGVFRPLVAGFLSPGPGHPVNSPVCLTDQMLVIVGAAAWRCRRSARMRNEMFGLERNLEVCLEFGSVSIQAGIGRIKGIWCDFH